MDLTNYSRLNGLQRETPAKNIIFRPVLSTILGLSKRREIKHIFVFQMGKRNKTLYIIS